MKELFESLSTTAVNVLKILQCCDVITKNDFFRKRSACRLKQVAQATFLEYRYNPVRIVCTYIISTYFILLQPL